MTGKQALLVLVGRRILFLQPYGEAAALSVSMLPDNHVNYW